MSLLTFFFQIDRLEPSFTDSVFRFRFRFRDSVSGFRILSFSAARNDTSVDHESDYLDIYSSRGIEAYSLQDCNNVDLLEEDGRPSEAENDRDDQPIKDYR